MVPDRFRRAFEGLAEAAFEIPKGSRGAVRSLAAAAILLGSGLVLAVGFVRVGVWFFVAAGWMFIAFMVWRYRDRIEFGRLKQALRDDRSREVDPLVPVPVEEVRK